MKRPSKLLAELAYSYEYVACFLMHQRVYDKLITVGRAGGRPSGLGCVGGNGDPRANEFIMKFDWFVARSLYTSFAKKFHDRNCIGRHSTSKSRETTPIRNVILALTRPPQPTAGLLVLVVATRS